MGAWLGILLVMGSGAASPHAADALKPIFDGRLSLRQSRPPVEEAALIEKLVHPDAREIYLEDCQGEDAFAVVDTASGSFTAPRTEQRAFLYVFCVQGHDFAKEGIAVLENRHLVAHWVYDTSKEYALGKLPDLDGNGLDELLTTGGSVNMGYLNASALITELDPDGVRVFGRFTTEENDCGAVEKGSEKAYRVSARPGPTPAFFRETFVTPCQGKVPWKPLQGRAPLELETDHPPVYVRVK